MDVMQYDVVWIDTFGILNAIIPEVTGIQLMLFITILCNYAFTSEEVHLILMSVFDVHTHVHCDDA